MSKPNTLIVSETFYSIQGEGQCAGTPAVFLRLGGCNLLCEGKGWRCDTIEVWQKSRAIPFEQVLEPWLIDKLRDGAHLVITGGEPLIHQDAIATYLDWLIRTPPYHCRPVVEIETNGTIMPTTQLSHYVEYWNVSFKLGSSGESYERRVNDLVLKHFNRKAGATFKVVISSHEDVLELVQDFPGLVGDRMILMPAGENQELLAKSRGFAIDAAMILGVRYCDRLHIVIWNKKTGV